MRIEIYIFLLIELMIVAWFDFKQRKILNLWSITNVLLGVLFLFSLDEYVWSWNLIIFPFSFLLAGFLLFAIKIMGGGDAKFMSSFFFLVPANEHWSFSEAILLMTVAVGGISLLVTYTRNYKTFITALRLRDARLFFSLWGKKFPFAPVLLLAWGVMGYKWL